MREIRMELVQKVKSAARAKPRKIAEAKPPQATVARRKRSNYDIIAIGASTGGPSAIERILTVLPDDFNIPVIICQHMPQAFIPPFVQRLNTLTNLEVIAATKDMEPTPGVVMFCPGHANLILNSSSRVDFTDKKYKEYNNPSINAMMSSVAECYGKKAVGVILTGMGKDGVEGMRNIHEKGGFTIAQDKETSVIYGMPKVAVESGVVDVSLDIKEIGNYLVNEI